MSFKKFLKNKGVTGAIFMAIFYQVIMIGLFIPGYSAVPKNIDKLHISIVNEDNQYGKTIAEQLKEQLPFKTIDLGQSLKDSKEELNNREVQLIIHIPNDFSSNLQSGKTPPTINYYLNESNPALITSTVKMVVSEIDSKLSEEFSFNKAKGILANLNVPEKQADQLAKSIGNSLNANLISINKMPNGMHNQMAPMFMTMVSYIGAMIASMMLVGAFKAESQTFGKWKTFGNLQLKSALMALIAPIIGIAILYLVHGYGGETFIQLWMHHSLEMFVALQFTMIFTFLFGQSGMLVNLPLLLTQTIAGGAVMNRDMMYGFFKVISYISPMYYSIQGDFTVLFGGGQLANYEVHLALIGLVAFAINMFVAVRSPKNKKMTNAVA